MAVKNTIFTLANSDKVQLNIKIDKKLKDDILNIEKQLEEINPDLRFDKNSIVIRALEEAVTKAVKELSTLEKSSKTEPLSVE